MKLELKHLSPYLPYRLKVSQPRCGRMEAYLMYGFKYSNYAREWVVFIDDSRHGDYQSSYLKGVKPILRPLSDLTKEIEVKGEKFVPQDKMKYLDLEWLINSDDLIMKTNYEDVLKLFEWHFDVFGLIEKNLAVSIHDVCQADA